MKRYGCWAGDPEGRAEDTTLCIEEVTPRDRHSISGQCLYRRGHGPSGLYCRTHAKLHAKVTVPAWRVPLAPLGPPEQVKVGSLTAHWVFLENGRKEARVSGNRVYFATLKEARSYVSRETKALIKICQDHIRWRREEITRLRRLS
jgi:hypothetical protein